MMAFDGIVTRAITNELIEEIEGGKISKIYQPTEHEIIMTVRHKGKNKTLLFSIHPNYARIHFTNEKYINPKEPPMFCMVLRKHLNSGTIEKIEQIELERQIIFTIKNKDEIGDETNKQLVFELMGKHSHLILVDVHKQMIIDSMKHISFLNNRHRAILPGQPYVAPPSQEKLNILTTDSETFIKKLDFNKGQIDQQILNTLMGFSPKVAKKLAEDAYLGDQEKYKAVFNKWQDIIKLDEFKPFISMNKKEDFHVIEFVDDEKERRFFQSTSEMLEEFFRGKAERDRINGLTNDLMRFLKNERNKNERKIKKHELTLKKAQEKELYQKKGELLTAHMHLCKLGDESINVVDYYDPEQKEITIALDPNKTPSENAQNYFNRYRKLKKSEEVVNEEIKKTKVEIDYFDRLIQQLEQARFEDIEDIREELQEEGYLKARQTKNKKKKKEIRLDYYESSDGTEIIVGRNNKQNEFLTNRLARKDDIWLHTKDIPGSHVIIRSSEPSEETLIEAASIAAFYSKAKMSSSVPVDYTFVRHVKKPNGAKPGYVIYDNQQTIFVTPNEKLVHKLQKMKS